MKTLETPGPNPPYHAQNITAIKKSETGASLKNGQVICSTSAIASGPSNAAK